MKLSVISFTGRGRRLAEKIKNCLPEAEVCWKPEQGVALWTGEQFEKKVPIIFVGACGIAVRLIAPYVKDKLRDSPVLVLDEKGRYVIPILSGHMGGANELAELLAKKIGAEAVITTATDINGAFAVDLFAKKNQLRILNKEGIKEVSAKVLSGEKVTISIEAYSDMEAVDGRGWKGEDREVGADDESVPDGIEIIKYPPKQKVDVLVSSAAEQREISKMAVLKLKPRCYVLGIGCKKGKTKEEISEFIRGTIEKIGISVFDIAVIASVDKKKNEEGIISWAREENIPFLTFTAEELGRMEGEFSGSVFVEQIMGVDNVCERASLAACTGEGELILRKQAKDGITLAVAKRKVRIRWEW